MPSKILKLNAILFLTMAGIFIIDQNIKMLFVDGFRYYTECIDLILVYNRGVAFSMLSFLDEWLKYIQLILVFGVLIYIINLKKLCFALPAGLLMGGALSNIYDRFIHGGVVDMVYWHCGFDFAVFNFADVMIDVAVVWFLILNFKPKLCKS
ncbi:MAG: signal peptidase II [Sulfurimonas sp.]|uniref:signal peptidase II n=1 Tax=Sulfurimonas sp. TaxID=2022749 RepID=UPI0026008ABB|nr:signal peptidase II [Sulfurimonas sp.]MCK9492516.1 signal peptidase II [Sulfurimonas sp.]